jgi:hypothetical protein
LVRRSFSWVTAFFSLGGPRRCCHDRRSSPLDQGIEPDDVLAEVVQFRKLRREGGNRIDAAVATLVEGVEADCIKLTGLGELRVGELRLDEGDSGSLILGEDRPAVGLLFAGTDLGGTNGQGLTYANPIATVLAKLKIEQGL